MIIVGIDIFQKDFEGKVQSTIHSFKLFDKKEKLLVGASGGKDSTTVLYILKKSGYNVEAVYLNLHIGTYSQDCQKKVTELCKEYKIRLHVISFRKTFSLSTCYMKSVLAEKGKRFNSCAICGIMRRPIFNKYARKIGAKRFVTGHNLDDECQSFLMNLLKAHHEKNARIGPISGIKEQKGFVPRVKPLYFCSEKEIEKYARQKKLPVIYGNCPCSLESYRRTIKTWLNKLEKNNPQIKENIIKYYLFYSKKLKAHFKSGGEMSCCIYCGEPSRDKICRPCQLMLMLR